MAFGTTAVIHSSLSSGFSQAITFSVTLVWYSSNCTRYVMLSFN